MLVTLINNRITSTKPQSFYSKQTLQPTVSQFALPNFADAKSFVNISFRGQYELYEAIENDDLETVKKELKRISVNTKFAGDMTPLMNAISDDATEVFEYLIKNPKVDVNARDDDGWTALHYSCQGNNKASYIEKLLQRDDININIQTGVQESTPLILACKKGDIDAIVLLLERPDLDLSLKDYEGNSALDIAQKNSLGSELIMRIQEAEEYQKNHSNLVARTVNIDMLSPEENIWTEEQITDKFKMLVGNENYAEAEKMLERTPLVDLSAKGNAVLKSVCTTGNPDFVRKVFEYERNQAEMKEQYEARRKAFMDNMQKMSYKELKRNNIALNTIEGFQILLEKPEFNPNDFVEEDLTLMKNTTLFDIACGLDDKCNLAKQIFAKYDDVDVKKHKKSCNKALKAAVKEYDTVGKYRVKLDNLKMAMINPALGKKDEATQKMIDFISSPEFKPNMTDTVGNNALHIISGMSTGNIRGLIQKLIDKGIDINSKNIAGQNCLMSAIKYLKVAQTDTEKENILSNIKFLMDKGVDIEDVDKNGQTVFHYVCSTASIALLMMMLKREPKNILVRDLQGNRPQIYLKDERMKEIYNKYINGNGEI